MAFLNLRKNIFLQDQEISNKIHTRDTLSSDRLHVQIFHWQAQRAGNDSRQEHTVKI